MYNALVIILFVWIGRSEPVVGNLDINGIQRELENLNMSCFVDQCKNRYDDDTLSFYSCICQAGCITSDTCCLDSYYITFDKPRQKHSCRSVYNGDSYFMVDRCPTNESVWNTLCKDDWNGENDVLKLVPVTSLVTSISYKNYFCFRCHETTDKFLYWKVKLERDLPQFNTTRVEPEGEPRPTSLIYVKHQGTWLVALNNEETPQTPVNLSMMIPLKVLRFMKTCVLDVISTCSDIWTDADMIKKCQGYTAIKVVQRNSSTIQYKNAHCALCNFENLNDIRCKPLDYTGSGDNGSFSFSYLLDVNRSVNDKEGIECDDEHMWDPFAEKCRKLS